MQEDGLITGSPVPWPGPQHLALSLLLTVAALRGWQVSFVCPLDERWIKRESRDFSRVGVECSWSQYLPDRDRRMTSSRPSLDTYQV